MKRFFDSTMGFYLVLVLATGLLFLRQQQLSVVIDRDGVTYLQAAAAFLEQGWAGALALKQQATWPFYPILIAYFSALSGFSVPVAAYSLDFFFSLMVVIAFVRIVSLIQGNQSLRYWALLAVLSWHEYTKFFPDVLRDHGFHCFLLLSVVAFYHYLQRSLWRYAFAWWLCLLAAFLFRLEAIVYLTLLPLGVVFSRSPHGGACNWRAVKLYLFPVMVVVGLILGESSLRGGLRFDEIYLQLTRVFTAIGYHWSHQVAHLQQTVFLHTRFVGWGLLAATVVIFLGLLLESFGVMTVAALGYWAWRRRIAGGLNAWRGVLYYGLVAALILVLFFMENFFLSGRYLVQLGFFVLLLVPFALHDAYCRFLVNKQWVSRDGLVLLLLLCTVCYSMTASLFRFGHHRANISVEISRWVRQNLPAEARIITNDKRVTYYTSVDGRLRRGDLWQRFSMPAQKAYLLHDASWHCHDYIVYVGKIAPFNQAYPVLRDQHLVIGKVKQLHAATDYDAVVVKVDPRACVK